MIKRAGRMTLGPPCAVWDAKSNMVNAMRVINYIARAEIPLCNKK